MPCSLDDLHLHVHSRFGALAAPIAVAHMAKCAGFSERAVREIEIAASELATNLMHHAGGGTLFARFTIDPHPGITLVAEDSGPGFEDIERALEDGVSIGCDLAHLPHPSRGGLGTGLGAIGRFTDGLTIENRPDGGALVIAFKSLS